MEFFVDLVSQYPEDGVCLVGYVFLGIGLFIGCSVSLVLGFVDNIFAWFRERKDKKSGKLTNDQRLELLEEKIDSLADIVISSSEEVK